MAKLSACSNHILAMLIVGLMCVGSAAAQHEAVLYTFVGGTDGSSPIAPLLADPSGNLFGTTIGGGAGCEPEGCGTVFELFPSSSGGWTESVLYRFQGGTDGVFPYGSLVMDAEGNLFGTTSQGGSEDISCSFGQGGCGTVFELSPPAPGGQWTETLLYRFQGGDSDGALPMGTLVSDRAGNLFGTTQAGGRLNCGSVFELRPSVPGGAWIERVLHLFDCTNGANPMGQLAIDSGGNLYGATFEGGDLTCSQNGCGAVFQMYRVNNFWKERVLHTFTGGTDGRTPQAGVILNKNSLYGTTELGGNNYGTAYKIDEQDGGPAETVIYDGAPTAAPYGIFALDAAGNLYGAASNGAFNFGEVYQLRRSANGGTTWTERTLYTFQGGADGAFPQGLIVFKNGIYGVAEGAGDSNACPFNFPPGCGVVFSITP
jgi:hypothetical protein